jgi:hypothetical protein
LKCYGCRLAQSIRIEAHLVFLDHRFAESRTGFPLKTKRGASTPPRRIKMVRPERFELPTT